MHFCKGVKIYPFSSEINFGHLLKTFGDFSGHTGRLASWQVGRGRFFFNET